MAEDLGSSAPRPEPALQADRLRAALEVGGTAIWFLDLATGTLNGDRGMSLLWGLGDGTPIDFVTFVSALHPLDADRVKDQLVGPQAGGRTEPLALEFRIRRARDGAERWIALSGRRLGTDEAGRRELVGTARDITSRKQHDAHVHLLMREVTHRSKNLLAIIQAMARQTVKDSLTASEFEERFSARLRGLAISHDLLAARDWHGAAVDDLVRWQLGPALEMGGSRVSFSGPSLFLKPEAAQNIGLAFNELTTNAIRFGALSNGMGRIAVEWMLDPEGTEPRRFHISWREQGGPPVVKPQRFGFGHKVVERLAARALDGTVSLTFAASGLQWSLHIPASFVSEAGPPPTVN